MQSTDKKNPYLLPVISVTAVMLLFWVIIPIYPNTSTSEDRLALWIADAWRKDFAHGWAVPFLFVYFIYRVWPQMKEEPIERSRWGLLAVAFTILLYVVSVRTLQPRLPLIGLPFLIVGGVQYVFGWKVARHMLFPAFFWWFAVSVPGLQQATNILQIAVTKGCYHVGTAMGMDLLNAGTEIKSGSDSWDGLDIAEGCSGIRSLMALVMISAIYSYFTQKKLWKMAFLFACSLPLALVANFFRIFTIIVLAEMGFSKFAAGVYHDWAGLLFFFPIALAGLFLIDKLLNLKENKKVVRKRIQT